MNMKIRITFDLNKEMRKAISHNYGYEKPATHEQCKSSIEHEMYGSLETMCYDLDKKYFAKKRGDNNEREL